MSLCIFSNTDIKLLKLHKSIPASGSSNIVSFDFLAASIAISILFNSPPDNPLFTSLFKYSCAHSPTSAKMSQASQTFILFPADISIKSFTVNPLNLTGCWNAKPIPNFALSVIDKFVISFSGGKDSQVTLDLITRVIPPSDFTVIYSDTGLEIPPSIQIFSDTEKFYKSRYPDIKFHLTSNQQNIFSYWEKIGAPTRMHRWCCAVMKTGPFYRYLKSISPDKKQPRVLVFEGVRAEESNKRSTYSRIGVGVKHSTVVNARPIFNWNTTEIFLYLLHITA